MTIAEQNKELLRTADYYRALERIAIISETDLQGRITYANDLFCEISQYRRDELLGRNHNIVNSGCHSPSFWKEFWKTIGQGRVWRGDICNKVKNGGFYWVDSAIIPLLDSEHRIDRYLSIRTVITPRKHIEESLRQREAQLKEAQRIAHVGSWTWDPAADAVSWSEELYRIFGLDPRRLPPPYQDHAKLFAPDSFAKLDAAVRRAVREGEPYEVDVQFVRADGARRYAVARGEAVRDAVGRVTFLHGTFKDVTDRVAAENRLKAAWKAAESANLSKTQFLANVSHEIRTPMNAVLGMIDLLMGTPLNVKQREFADIARQAGESLLSLITDILDISKIEAGKVAIGTEDFDLAKLLHAVSRMMINQAMAKGLRVSCHIDPALPKTVRGDPAHIRQVLTNLMANAVKFTEDGRVTLRVKLVRRRRSQLETMFSVQDTGIGIPVEAQQDLFKSFQQGDGSTQRKYGGVGLGLAISKQLVGLMGGTISVVSESGKGSTFFFTLPLKASRRSPGWPSRANRRAASRPPARRHQAGDYRILVVEDQRFNQVLIAAQMEALGYRADIVANGLEALDRLRRHRYDLVIMDCQMPGMDGFEATRLYRHRERGGRLPIIAMTANAMGGDREKCLAAGMDDYLAKPVSAEALGRLLNHWLGAARRLKAGPPAEEPAVDLATLRSVTSGDKAHQCELIGIYLEESARNLLRLRSAMRRASAKDLAAVAHAWLGSSRCFGAQGIAKPLAILADMGRCGRVTSRAAQVADQVEAELRRIEKEIRPFRDQLRKSLAGA